MINTITKTCEICDAEFEGIKGGVDFCEECVEEEGTDHYEETVEHRENNSGLI